MEKQMCRQSRYPTKLGAPIPEWHHGTVEVLEVVVDGRGLEGGSEREDGSRVDGAEKTEEKNAESVEGVEEKVGGTAEEQVRIIRWKVFGCAIKLGRYYWGWMTWV